MPERFASSRKLARIAEAVHPLTPPRTSPLTPRAWALALLSLPVVTFAVLVRFRGLYDVFCRTPDELAEVMPGLRLHALPFFNLAAPVPYNFFKSMFYSQHGLGDVSFYYLASALVSLLGFPISERNLFVAGGVASLGLALAGGLFCGRVLGRPLMGWIFALLVLVSPFYVLVSRTGWARLSWTPLLLFALFLAQATATTRRGVVRPAVFWALAGLVSLTDGFVAFPLLPVLALVLESGTLAERVRNVARDRVFVIGLALFGLGLAFDVALGVLAHLKGSNLTMMGYVIQRGGGGFRLSRVHLIAWAHAIDWYFPFRGAWAPVTAAWLLAAWAGLKGRRVGFVAAWWLVASLAILRYAAGLERAGITPPVPSRLNAYQLAPPSFLLVAWALAALVEGGRSEFRRIPRRLRSVVGATLLLALVTLMARDAEVVAVERVGVDGGQAGSRLGACRTVKAAAYYVRTHGDRSTYVFHLSSDVFLGHIGEFYYGLNYGRWPRPDDPNRLLDFGLEALKARYPPDAFYAAYGVRHFDYYVDFLDDRDPFKASVVDRLLGQGARVVCVIRDGGRPIGRILSFRAEAPVDLEYRLAARGWDRAFAWPRTLLQQPLTGGAYHFNYNWRAPAPAPRS